MSDEFEKDKILWPYNKEKMSFIFTTWLLLKKVALVVVVELIVFNQEELDVICIENRSFAEAEGIDYKKTTMESGSYD